MLGSALDCAAVSGTSALWHMNARRSESEGPPSATDVPGTTDGGSELPASMPVQNTNRVNREI